MRKFDVIFKLSNCNVIVRVPEPIEGVGEDSKRIQMIVAALEKTDQFNYVDVRNEINRFDEVEVREVIE